MPSVKTVDEYIDRRDNWQEELQKLRKIILSAGLTETIKWGGPTYTVNGKNVVGLGGYKNYVSLWFYQGALIDDPDGVLVNAQEGRTKSQRQWRFESAAEIKVRKVKAYVQAARAVAESGKTIAPARNKPVVIPPELEAVFSRRARTRKAFAELGVGKQREYAEYISDAKREATKTSRIDKIVPMIEAGAGLNDKYRR